jgi:hypothetical protein
MVVEARVLTRCCFENLFTVVKLQEKGSAFVEKMDADRKAIRKARGEFLLKHSRDAGLSDQPADARGFCGHSRVARGRKRRGNRAGEIIAPAALGEAL